MTEQQLNEIIAQGEDYYHEFKRSMSSDFNTELVAFANASGGTILLGVDDDRTIHGITINNRLRSKIQTIASSCDPTVPIELEQTNNVLIVRIPEGQEKPYRCAGGFYLRVGANSQKMNTDEIIDFIQYEGRIRFDEQLAHNVDFNSVYSTDLVDRFKKKSNLITSLPPEDLLVNLGVIKVQAGRPKLTNAGLLFFSERPTTYLPQAMITCVVYKGVEKTTIIDQKDFTNDLVSTIEETIYFLKRHLNKALKIDDLKRQDDYEIPLVVLREAVVNAVAHRNYLETGARVMVEIFDDRVEISNPGGLPKGLKPEDFGKYSLTRNPLVADLLHRIGYIEKLGTGIPRIRETMQKAGLAEPQFSFDGFFSITVQREHKAVNEAVNQAVNKAVNKAVNEAVSEAVRKRLADELLYIISENGITLSAIKEKYEIQRGAAQTDVKRLRDAGLIEFIGPPKTGKYVLTETAKEKLLK